MTESHDRTPDADIDARLHDLGSRWRSAAEDPRAVALLELPTGPSPASRGVRRREPWLAGAAAVAAAVLLLGAAVAVGTFDDEPARTQPATATESPTPEGPARLHLSANSGRPVLIDVRTSMEVATPVNIAFGTSGDAQGIHEIGWTSWGEERAVGRGMATVAACLPEGDGGDGYCVSQPLTPATVVLDRPRDGAFTRATVTADDGEVFGPDGVAEVTYRFDGGRWTMLGGSSADDVAAPKAPTVRDIGRARYVREPDFMSFATHDGAAALSDLRWSRWSKDGATGDGTFQRLPCAPSCVQSVPVTVRLTERDGDAFTRATVTASEGVPLWDGGPLQVVLTFDGDAWDDGGQAPLADPAGRD